MRDEVSRRSFLGACGAAASRRRPAGGSRGRRFTARYEQQGNGGDVEHSCLSLRERISPLTASRTSFRRNRWRIEEAKTRPPFGDLDRRDRRDVAERLAGPAGRPGDFERPGSSRHGPGRRCRPGVAAEARTGRDRPVSRDATCRRRPARSTRILAPSAARLVRVPTSLIVSQWWPCPGFWNRTLWARSPGAAPPASRKMSASPSRSQSAKATPCPFWRWPGPGRRGDVLEPPAADVAEQHVGHQVGVRRPAGPQVDVEEAVVVDVAEVRAHRQDDPVEPDLGRHVAEASDRRRCGRAGAARRSSAGRAGRGSTSERVASFGLTHRSSRPSLS